MSFIYVSIQYVMTLVVKYKASLFIVLRRLSLSTLEETGEFELVQ